MSGEITFTAERPPQSFVFCGICDSHFMFCECTGAGRVDYIYKGLPPPSPSLTCAERLRRFASLVAVSPSMGRFNAMAWHRNESSDVVASLQARKPQLKQMMEDYISGLPTDPLLKSIAEAVGGQPLKDQNSATQVEAVAKECRAAVSSFISGDWSTVTKVGILLIQNSFQASDPAKYPTSDSHLDTVFQKGVSCLQRILNIGFSDERGWRLALECDRLPQGTDDPLESATTRDYFLQYVNANPHWRG